MSTSGSTDHSVLLLRLARPHEIPSVIVSRRPSLPREGMTAPLYGCGGCRHVLFAGELLSDLVASTGAIAEDVGIRCQHCGGLNRTKVGGRWRAAQQTV